MKPGAFARTLPAKKARARRLPSILAALPNDPEAARRVKLAGAACGPVGALVDEDPAGARFRDYPRLRLGGRSGEVTRRPPHSVRCPEQGATRGRERTRLP